MNSLAKVSLVEPDLPHVHGTAHLWKTDDGQHLITDCIYLPHKQSTEMLVFTANEYGQITNFTPLHCAEGKTDHIVALRSAGYEY